MYNIKQWRHVFKLDPAKTISDNDLDAICMSNTDAIILGGTDNVTEDNVIQLMSRVRRYPLPLVLEVSNIESVMPGFDFYFIPTVLNSNNVKYHNGMLLEALKEYGHVIDFDEVIFEGYLVMNEDSKVAQRTNANTQLDINDIDAYALMANELYRFPIMYLENSGKYGEVDTVKSVKDTLTTTQLFYGGGITTLSQAKEMAEYADTIVVGDIIYKDKKKALKTVKVKESSK